MKAYDSKIGEFINRKSFIIPAFQRYYVWEKENCETLWEDLCISVENKQPHYLGNIFYFFDNTNLPQEGTILIDGQQRIITLFLLLCALRDVSDDKSIENEINDLIFKKNYSDSSTTKELKIQIISSQNDELKNIAFSKNVHTKTNFYKNYLFFVSKLKNKKNEKQSNINEWFKKIFFQIQRMDIVEIRLENNNLNYIQTIFEKINFSGRPLANSDLIRNSLLSSTTIEEQNSLYNEYWSKLEDPNILGIEYLPDFLENFFLTKGYFNNKKTFLFFKEYTSQNNNRTEILKEFLEYSKYYKKILECNTKNKNINKYLKELKALKYSFLKPLLLLLFYKLNKPEDEKELANILNLFVLFLVRYRVCNSNKGGSKLTAFFTKDIILELSKNDIINKKEYIKNKILNWEEYPNDERFSFCLSNYSFLNQSDLAKILLNKIECWKYKDIDIPFDWTTLEHVLPQAIDNNWKKELGIIDKDHENKYDKLKYSLGNLVLLSQRQNSTASNNLFKDKKNMYINSSFSITRDLVKENTWNDAQIKKRTNELVHKAIKAIKIN
ncbi:DUF262 domain-containing protein [Mesomycoplasma neurolyticum]|uniref:Uncharacterized conserved protein n=1 Tax=Mesomycoplasma neurolyticum TaxID=2120 RepID=A0A449A4E9_9BACT|nr:DUF262 domain-containing protein [Mesomycoplasma neurolyticum]VEU59084.1 Uncharacterized conserved protein [Mesomycoplasma neurolyticum]